MENKRIMLMSGFLGSGKTTGMLAIATYLQQNGKRIGLITNDLGSNLVDTNYLSCEGIPVLEIANGCLCHDVDQLVEKINMLIAENDPDIVVFEPVGACVDMVRNVYRNINFRFKNQYTLAPVSAIVDPIRYQAIYMCCKENTFPETTSYMFKKQLEEADLLLLNKIDLFSDETIEAITDSLNKEFPGIPVIPISCKDMTNIDQWAEYAFSHESAIRDLDIDMDYVYEFADDMGWFNKVCVLKCSRTIDFSLLNDEYLRRIRTAFLGKGTEIAHAKVIAKQNGNYCKTALTSCNGDPQSIGDLKDSIGNVTFNVNIRALMQPKELAELMEKTLLQLIAEQGIVILGNLLQSFRFSDDTPEPQGEFDE